MMSIEKANSIYDLLVATGGASKSRRDEFVQYVTTHEQGEYRFMGLFGFGGKFRYYPSGRKWVDCYPEDQTTERDEILKRLNAQLATIS